MRSGKDAAGAQAKDMHAVVKQQHQLFVSLLCMVDALVVSAACMLAWFIRREHVEGFAAVSWENWVKEPFLLFAVPVTLYSMWCFKLYRPRRDRSVWSEQGQLFKASLAAIAGLVCVLWVLGNDAVRGVAPYGPATVMGVQLDPGRFQLGLLAVILPVFLCVHRLGFRYVLRQLRRKGWNQRYCAIIGVGRLGQIACRTLARNSWTGLNIAYFVSHHDQNKRSTCLNRPVRGGLEDLERVLEKYPVDAVYLALPNSCAAAMPKLLQRLERYPIDVRMIPDVHPRYLSQNTVVSELDGMPILSYRESPLYGLGGLSKRIVDMLGSLAALVIFSPVMLAIAIAVKFTSPGPVIFKQRRVSIGGQTFKIYKFRTMFCAQQEADGSEGPRRRTYGKADEDAPKWTDRDDPRITPIGRWLRKTSLDELPQFLNVLKGQMSLVGPRPERPELIAKFKEDWRGYMLRQHVKAGITGWAQVNGLRGDTSLKKRLQHDLFYIRHWSIAFDLKILLLTLFRLHRNAH